LQKGKKRAKSKTAPSYPLVEIKEVIFKATCKKLTAPNFIASKLSSFARGL